MLRDLSMRYLRTEGYTYIRRSDQGTFRFKTEKSPPAQGFTDNDGGLTACSREAVSADSH
jgi:hypothetical protein